MKRLILLLCLVLLPVSAQAKIILGDTNDIVRVVTASAVSTMNVYAAWADITTTALTPGMTNTLITTATTTTVVAAPGASTQRQVKVLTIYNSHASSSNATTVEVYDGTNAAVLIKYTILAGETLQYTDDGGFVVIDASGQRKAAIDSELPAAAALADNTANPTVPGVSAFLMCYDGATWDRCQGGLTDTDDGTIATSQVPGLMIPLNYVYDGTNWVRRTIALEDAAETAGGQLTMAGSVRRDTQASSAGTAGDNATLNTDATGNLWVTGTVIEDAAETAGGALHAMGSVRRDTAASSAGTAGDNATVNTDANGLLWTRNMDPCSGVAKSYLPVSISTATTTEITPSLAGASTHYYICSINLVTAAANNVLVADDDTDNCASPTTGIFGSDGTPAASEGWNFAANGGIVLGNGQSSVGRTQGTNRVICIITSAATQLSGMLVVVAAP